MQRFVRTRQHREQSSSQTGQIGVVEMTMLGYEWPAKEIYVGEGWGFSRNYLCAKHCWTWRGLRAVCRQAVVV
jgi:hypothetical protein